MNGTQQERKNVIAYLRGVRKANWPMVTPRAKARDDLLKDLIDDISSAKHSVYARGELDL